MRKLITILFLGLTINSFGQADTASIYYQALFYYNSHLDISKSKSTEIFIENNDGITDKLPSIIGNRTVTILTGKNQKEIYNKNNNKIVHVKIFPARIKNNIIEIGFTPYSGEFKGRRKGYYLSVGDWIIIQFKYDCIDNTYKYYKTVTGGI
jgi:hypothetical protein